MEIVVSIAVMVMPNARQFNKRKTVAAKKIANILL